MDLRNALSVTCILACVVGALVIRLVFTWRACRTRCIPFDLAALATTEWLRDDAGRFRPDGLVWSAVWVVFCFLAMWLCLRL
jgi:hypothetical protein